MIIQRKYLKKIINKSLKETRFFLSHPYEKLKDESKIALSRYWVNFFNFYLRDLKKRNEGKLPQQRKEDENVIGIKSNEDLYAFDIRNFKLFNLNIQSELDELTDNRVEEYCEKNNIDLSQADLNLIDRKMSVISFIKLPISISLYFSDVMIDKMNKVLKDSSITTIRTIDELKYILSISELVSSDSTLSAARMSAAVGYPSQSFDDEDYLNAKQNSDENIVKFLREIASPSTFISFIDAYEFNLDWNEDSEDRENEYLPPKLSLNPNATFGTPHAIYGYPFDKENCELFLRTGKPTYSKFATNRNYFHLIKIDLNNPRVILFKADGTCNHDINKKEYFSRIKELHRLYKLFYRDMSKDNEYIDKRDEEREILQDNLNVVYSEFIDFMRDGMFIDEYARLKNNPFYLLYRFAGYLSRLQGLDAFDEAALESNKKNKGHSEFSALLLHSIGIDCIVDRGLGIVHRNEPSQAHILTFNNSSSTIYKYLGTYKNFKNK